MEKHVCKLCLRRFPNGRALGGHMRSHVLAARQQEQQKLQQQEQPNSPLSSSSSSSYEAAAAAERKLYGLRENPRKSVRLSDPEFYGGSDHHPSSSPVLQDRESDTESKRPRRPLDDPEPLSSVSDTTPDEDVALCLVMLSRHAWSTRLPPDESDVGDEEDDDAEIVAVRSRSGRYRCETCDKAFGSYQALGGHRASHKKVHKPPLPDDRRIPDADPGSDGCDGARIHECPFCFRVFPSGQALGGHKRSHLVASSSSSRAFAAPVVDRNHRGLIDLNLPATAEEPEDGGSQVEYSAVSNADP